MMPKMLATQNIIPGLVNAVLYLAIVVFFLLAARGAAKSNKSTLRWIVPMLWGFGLSLFGSLFNLLFWVEWSINPRKIPSFNNIGPFNIPRYIYHAAIALLAFGAFRLWQMMRQADDSRPQAPPVVSAAPSEGVWPPPPTRGE